MNYNWCEIGKRIKAERKNRGGKKWRDRKVKA